MTSPEARNCDRRLLTRSKHIGPDSGPYRCYQFLGFCIQTVERSRPVFTNAYADTTGAITRAEAARLLQWWRAQSQEAARS